MLRLHRSPLGRDSCAASSPLQTRDGLSFRWNHAHVHPPHPGSLLRDYLGSLSVTEAAQHLGVSRLALSRVLNGAAGISADMALRLSEALGTSPELWTGMQAQYDLWQASQKRRNAVRRVSRHSRRSI